MYAQLQTSDGLARRVDSALGESPYLSRHVMHFEAVDGRVVLRGCVPSFFHKQMAQETVRRVDGVCAVDNHLEVDWR